jgi:transcriptional regulator with XRE-family HTH domain
MTEYQVLKRLRAFCEEAGTQHEAAKRLGVSQPTISLILLGKRPLEPKVLTALGLQRHVSYRSIPPRTQFLDASLPKQKASK